MRKDLWDCIDSVSDDVGRTWQRASAYRHRETWGRCVFFDVAMDEVVVTLLARIGVGSLGSLRAS